MDIQTALRIMELTPSADLDDAREAFRRLAKRHHPDRGKYSPEIGAGDDRMKEINLAFHLLKQELSPSGPREAVDKAKKRRPQNPDNPFSLLFETGKNRFFKTGKAGIPARRRKTGPVPKVPLQAGPAGAEQAGGKDLSGRNFIKVSRHPPAMEPEHRAGEGAAPFGTGPCTTILRI